MKPARCGFSRHKRSAAGNSAIAVPDLPERRVTGEEYVAAWTAMLDGELPTCETPWDAAELLRQSKKSPARKAKAQKSKQLSR